MANCSLLSIWNVSDGISNYKFSVPFEGIFMTLPLVLAFIYWAQKSNDILLLSGLNITKKDGFNFDLFLLYWLRRSLYFSVVS